jgi:hypothetical protein
MIKDHQLFCPASSSCPAPHKVRQKFSCRNFLAVIVHLMILYSILSIDFTASFSTQRSAADFYIIISRAIYEVHI